MAQSNEKLARPAQDSEQLGVVGTTPARHLSLPDNAPYHPSTSRPRQEVQAGGVPLNSEATAFAGQQTRQLRHVGSGPQFWLPEWVRSHIGAEGSPEALVTEALRRVQAQPDEATLLEAQAVLNELTRSAEGTALVRRIVTPETLVALTGNREG